MDSRAARVLFGAWLALACLLAGGATPAGAQLPPILLGVEAYKPVITSCVHPDILAPDNVTILMSECDGRSNGCNTETTECIMGVATNNLNTSQPLVDFGMTIYGEFFPGVRDGAVRLDMSFIANPLFGPKGWVQLWRETPEDNVFMYTQQSHYINTAPSPSGIVDFVELEAGTHVLVYWDVGGTRGGSGVPEYSHRFEIGNVMDRDYSLRVDHVPNGVTTSDCNQCPFTLINRPQEHQIVWAIFGDGAWETQLLNAADHNREVWWEYRTNQGNIISVAKQYPRAPIRPGGFEQYHDVYPFHHRAVLMMAPTPVMMQARLMYIGKSFATHEEFYTNRQVYTPGTVIDYEVLNFQRIFQTNSANQVGRSSLNNIQVIDEHNIRLVYNVVWRPSNSWNAGGTSFGRGTGEMGIWEDYWKSEEFTGMGVQEGRIFRPFPTFEITRNFRSVTLDSNIGTGLSSATYTNDLVCFPRATFYAKTMATQRVNGGVPSVYNIAMRTSAVGISWDYAEARRFWGCDQNGANNCDNFCMCGNDAACNSYTWSGYCTLDDFHNSGNCDEMCESGSERIYTQHGTSAYTPGHAMFTGPFDEPPNNQVPDDAAECLELTGNCIRRMAPGTRDPKMAGGITWMNTPPAHSGTFYWSWPFLQFSTQYNNRLNFLDQDNTGTTRRHVVHYQTEPAWNDPDLRATDLGGGFGLVNEGSFARYFSVANNGEFGGEVGPDVQTITNVVRNGGATMYSLNNGFEQIRQYIAATAFSYARFKVAPHIDFMGFGRARRGEGGNPDTIEMRFKVSCPFVDFDTSNDPAYCAEVGRIYDQFDNVVDMVVLEGGTRTIDVRSTGYKGEQWTGIFDPPPSVAVPYGTSNDLSEVSQSKEFLVQIEYEDNMVVHWCFNNRVEYEMPIEMSGGPSGFCELCSSLEVEVPPKAYVLMDMIAAIATVPPVCEYNQPEEQLYARRGEFFAYAGLIATDANDQVSLGLDVLNPKYYHYYSRWNINGAIIEGFSESVQTFEPGTTVTVYDQREAILLDEARMVDVVAINSNGIVRPTRCSTNGTCPVHIDDPPDVSHIGQHHQCSLDLLNQVILTPELVFTPGFTLANVGAIFFNMTTEFIDVFIEEIRFAGIDQFDNVYLVTETGYYTLKIRYGRSIDNILDAPCFERLIDFVIVLNDFQVDPLPIERIPGCTRPDNCCYRVPLVVRGNTPNNTDIVDLATCAGYEDACKYEVLYSPAPVVPELGLCLGSTYSVTVRSPQTLVDARPFPIFGRPWRCPTTFSLALPPEGFAPVEVNVLAGPCSNPGGVVEFTLRYTSPACTGPITLDNPDPNCRFELVFGLEITVAQGPIGWVAGADPSTGGYTIDGNNSIPFNVQTKFIFPDQFSVDPGATLQNGEWHAVFWLRTADNPTLEYDDVEDGRQVVERAFTSIKEDAEGIRIVRNEITRPTCPAEFGDPDPQPITVGFTILDSSFEGPYEVFFRTPTGQELTVQLITAGGPLTCSPNCTITADLFCAGACSVPFDDPDTGCDGCDIKMRDEGIQMRGLIGTGAFSPFESGTFSIYANSRTSDCNGTYFENIIGLDTLIVQLECFDTSCPGSQNGYTVTAVTGGTKIPFQELELTIGPDFELYKPLYYYSWARPDGTSTLPFLSKIPEGQYELNVTDYNGCVVSAQCTVGTTSPPMRLNLVNSTAPKCVDGPGEIVFNVTGGVLPHSLMKVGPDQGPVGGGSGVILMDDTVVPNEDFFYVAVDALGCISPIVEFNLESEDRLAVSLVVVRRPCLNTDPTGVISVVITGSTGDFIEWFFNNGTVPFASGSTLTAGTVSGRQKGIYTVRVTSIFGCVAMATTELIPVNDIAIQTQRSPNTVVPGVINGLISGGNGPPYTLTVVPQDVLFVEFQSTLNQTFFRLTNVPVGWNGILRVQDRVGCASEKQEIGQGIPIDIPFMTPSPTALPPDYVKPFKNKNDITFMSLFLSIFFLFVFLSLYALYVYYTRMAREEERQRRLADTTPLLDT